ncbi:MAG: DNA mismatch repair endonuclease MutL [Holosporales bacterium]|jgi:DNA mismatch repair protein MutL
MPIRLLPPALVNRIAAGEVIERPAAVLKELLENALDAGATRIDVSVEHGGKSLLVVEDDGGGIRADELSLAVERHATSKLEDEHLVTIRTFGFRGEALPSIGAVARLSITSATAMGEAARITVTGGVVSPVSPAARGQGTTVEVRDLFFATPARLKFLRSDASEWGAAADVLEKQALAHCDVAFTCRHHGRVLRQFSTPATLRERAGGILGDDFLAACQEVDAMRNDGTRLHGLIASPTCSRSTSTSIHLYVNRRPVFERALTGALRAAYQDVLAGGRFPLAVLFFEVPEHLVDVNVHPAKTEVRFADASGVRGFLIGAVRAVLHQGAGVAPHRVLLRPVVASSCVAPLPSLPLPAVQPLRLAEPMQSYEPAPVPVPQPAAVDPPLGFAVAQVFETYIVAHRHDEMVLVDQHAAHERLVYEQLKADLAVGAAGQPLLTPEVVTLPASTVEAVVPLAPALARLGLEVERFGDGAVLVRSVPALLKNIPLAGLLADLAEHGGALEEKLTEKLADVACRASVRAGRRLSIPEMNALLRQMEATPAASQCNHGRPTYIRLQKGELERLFKR